jgi:hypothetical protein
MEFSWLTLFGGGVVAAATLSVGISMSGLLAPSTSPLPERSNAVPSPETVYVEQPVVEVGLMTSATPSASQPPLIIAILPADTATNVTSTDYSSSPGETRPTPPTAPPTITPTTPLTPVVTPTPAPTLTPIVRGGEDSGEDHDGEDNGGEDDGGHDD